MSHVTDRNHLSRVVLEGLAALVEIEQAWLAEDQAACAPRSNGSGGPISGGGTSDPVASIATGRDRDDDTPHPPVDAAKYADRDRLGKALLTLVGRLKELVEERTPRRAGGPCGCCGERGTATHGRDHRGRPTDCWACWRFLKRMGYRCDAEVHQGRPEVRMCQCPPECCEVCDQRATDGPFSDRCAARIRQARSA